MENKEKIELEILLSLSTEKKENSDVEKVSTNLLEKMFSFYKTNGEDSKLPLELIEQFNNEVKYFDTHGEIKG